MFCSLLKMDARWIDATPQVLEHRAEEQRQRKIRLRSNRA